MFSCCFTGEGGDAHQVNYGVADPKMDEGLGGQRVQMPSAVPKLKGTIPGPGGDGGDSAPSTGRSLTPEEKQREKERLQEMVKEFAKAVVQGQPCELIDESLGRAESQPRDANYMIDRSLKMFSLSCGDATSPKVQFEMTQILEILKDARQTPLAFLLSTPAAGFSPEKMERNFICVQYQDDAGSIQFLGLFMPNAYERERFYTCMKILRWAMDSRKSQPAA